MTVLKIAVAGASGRMGKMLIESIAEAEDTVLAGALDIPESPFLAIPEVSSETRDYLPIGWLEPPTIPSNKLRFVQNACLWHFGVLTSAMHMAWLRDVGGRLESRFQYGIYVVYNTFPWPEMTERQKDRISQLAQAILETRALYPESTPADLYDATLMKRDLRQAHKALDIAVDRLYRAAPFNSGRDRAEHLFGLYEKLVIPLIVAASPPTRGPRKRT